MIVRSWLCIYLKKSLVIEVTLAELRPYSVRDLAHMVLEIVLGQVSNFQQPQAGKTLLGSRGQIDDLGADHQAASNCLSALVNTTAWHCDKAAL